MTDVLQVASDEGAVKCKDPNSSMKNNIIDGGGRNIVHVRCYGVCNIKSSGTCHRLEIAFLYLT